LNGDPRFKVPATHICGNEFLDKLENESSETKQLKYDLGTFFKSIQDILVVYVNNGNALDNSMRANLLGPYFNERHWPQPAKTAQNPGALLRLYVTDHHIEAQRIVVLEYFLKIFFLETTTLKII
jgi:hypothetical protein